MFPFSGSGRASWKNHGASLPQSTFEWREEGPFSPAAVGTWLPALGAGRRLPIHAALVCGWLLSEGPCKEAGGLRGGSRGSNQPLSKVCVPSGFFWLAHRQEVVWLRWGRCAGPLGGALQRDWDRHGSGTDSWTQRRGEGLSVY